MVTRGRPPKPLDPDSTIAAWLGAELRAWRQKRGLTQQALGDRIAYTFQHVSEVERGKAAPTQPFIAACDRALDDVEHLPGTERCVVSAEQAQKIRPVRRQLRVDLVRRRGLSRRGEPEHGCSGCTEEAAAVGRIHVVCSRYFAVRCRFRG